MNEQLARQCRISLEPFTRTLLALAQNHLAIEYLDILAKVYEDPGFKHRLLIQNYCATRNPGEIEKAEELLQELRLLLGGEGSELEELNQEIEVAKQARQDFS